MHVLLSFGNIPTFENIERPTIRVKVGVGVPVSGFQLFNEAISEQVENILARGPLTSMFLSPSKFSTHCRVRVSYTAAQLLTFRAWNAGFTRPCLVPRFKTFLLVGLRNVVRIF